MKIGLGPRALLPELHLPIEIISQIVHHLARLALSARSLWSCCLVSHSWYGAAVPYLYRYPKLINKNFDLFVRTICPPVSSHVRNVGLEGFVQRLDMKRLAYESTNSLTARLVGRVGPSLEYFVAPPVSFSISCLAPLSKCELMKTLDLCHVYQSLDVRKLLRSVRKLTKLTILRLPDTAMVPPEGWLQDSVWPPSLVELQLPGWLFQGSHVADMVASWPPGLTELMIRHCRTCPLLTDRATYDTVKAPGIRTLTLQDSYQSTQALNLLRVFTVFPAMLNLTLPAEDIALGIPDMISLDFPLETLELKWRFTKDDGILTDFRKQSLLRCIVNLPHMWQLAVDERCILSADGYQQPVYDMKDLDELTLPLKQRAEARNREAGYEEIDLREAGFISLID